MTALKAVLLQSKTEEGKVLPVFQNTFSYSSGNITEMAFLHMWFSAAGFIESSGRVFSAP
jgi:hypothetical protein